MTFTPDDLDSFPFVDDFLVRLVDAGEGNLQIELASAARGRLAGFPAWDHADRDLRHFIPSDVPLGTIDEPYDDRDEGWRIVIFEHGGWMYVAEGDGVDAAEPSSLFRVRRERYLQAWAALIDLFNPITPLDDTKTDEPS
jgi:hypothetical protein